MTISVVGAYSSKGDDRNSKYTPAVTRVAAWIRAESGNQVCNPSCADLPIAAKSSNNPITVSAVSLMKGERLNTVL